VVVATWAGSAGCKYGVGKEERLCMSVYCSGNIDIIILRLSEFAFHNLLPKV
jgi:hypothetical protein